MFRKFLVALVGIGIVCAAAKAEAPQFPVGAELELLKERLEKVEKRVDRHAGLFGSLCDILEDINNHHVAAVVEILNHDVDQDARIEALEKALKEKSQTGWHEETIEGQRYIVSPPGAALDFLHPGTGLTIQD